MANHEKTAYEGLFIKKHMLGSKPHKLDYLLLNWEDLPAKYNHLYEEDTVRLHPEQHPQHFYEFRILLQKYEMMKKHMVEYQQAFDSCKEDRNHIEKMNKDLVKLTLENKSLKEKLHNVTLEYKLFKTSYKDAAVTSNENKNYLYKKMDDIKELKEENTMVKTSNVNKERTIKELREQLEYTKRNYKHIESVYNRDLKDYRVCAKELITRKENEQKDKLERQRIDNNIADLEIKLDQNIKLIRQADHERIQSVEKYNRILDRKNDYENKIKEQKKQIEQKGHTINNLIIENKNLKKDNNECVIEKTKAEKMFDALKDSSEKEKKVIELKYEKLNEKYISVAHKYKKLRDEKNELKEKYEKCFEEKEIIEKKKTKYVFATREIEEIHKENADLKKKLEDTRRKYFTSGGIPMQLVGTNQKVLHKVRSFDQESNYCDCGVTEDDDKYIRIKEKKNCESRIHKLTGDIKDKEKIIEKQNRDINSLSDTIDYMRIDMAEIKAENKKLEDKSLDDDKKVICVRAKTEVQRQRALKFERMVRKHESRMIEYGQQIRQMDKERRDAVDKAHIAHNKVKRYLGDHKKTVTNANFLYASKIEVKNKSQTNQEISTKNIQLEIKLNSLTEEFIELKDQFQKKETKLLDKINNYVTKINEQNDEIKKLKKLYDYDTNMGMKTINELSRDNKKLTIENKSLTYVKNNYTECKLRERVLKKFNLNKSLTIDKYKAINAQLMRKLRQRVYRYRIPNYIHFTSGQDRTSRMIEIPEEYEEDTEKV